KDCCSAASFSASHSCTFSSILFSLEDHRRLLNWSNERLTDAETPKAPLTNPNPIRANQQKVGSSSSLAALSLLSSSCLSLPVEGLLLLLDLLLLGVARIYFRRPVPLRALSVSFSLRRLSLLGGGVFAVPSPPFLPHCR
ncbi:hypothetical protein HN873_040959, partial [Arachis hypogaea]